LLLKKNAFKWDLWPLDPAEGLIFWKYDLEARTYIREIFNGPWAFCPELAKTGKLQYELVAARDIQPDEWIGEYTGVIDFRPISNIGKKYSADFFIPTSVDLSQGDLCVDGEYYGNETRFINSITDDTPDYIKTNSTMTTVWCAGKVKDHGL